MRKHRENKLSEAIAQLKKEGESQEVPQEVLDETLRRIADCRLRIADSSTLRLPIRGLVRFAAAAAVFVLVGYTAGRLSSPKPMDLDELREVLTPSVAASLEPALRERVTENLRSQYQLALAGMYVRVKEELTEQYRNDLNRFAMQTLAASNAVTNELLTQLVQEIDTAKTQDLRRVARAIYEIEMNRVQDKTQLASGLQTLANRTEDELSRTKRDIAQFLVDVRPAGSDGQPTESRRIHEERNKP
jgi:hypothetical protein